MVPRLPGKAAESDCGNQAAARPWPQLCHKTGMARELLLLMLLAFQLPSGRWALPPTRTPRGHGFLNRGMEFRCPGPLLSGE